MSQKSHHVMVIAAEPSGDRLGARLIAALNESEGGDIRISGVGGPQMQKQGVQSLVPIDDLAVMGLAQVAPVVFKALSKVDKIIRAAMETRPDAVVLVDSSGFTDRIGAGLRKRNFPGKIIKYVAPQVWASRPYRVQKIAKFLDHVLTLYPFEPAYFERENLSATFVGHPLTEEGTDKADPQEFLQRYGIEDDALRLCVLPGSRSNEISFLLPVFRDTVARLAKSFPALHLILPITSNVAERVKTEVSSWPAPATFVENEEDKYAAFRASRAALAASGTVTLELAMNGVPLVVAYKVGWLTSTIFRPFILSKHICILNILAEKRIVPEFIQEECHPHLLANALSVLLQNDMAHSNQVASITEAFNQLRDNRERPSARAAKAVLAVIDGEAAKN